MSQVLFPNESVPIILARMIGTIGRIDMEMLASGQETQKYFTDDYDIFHKNEVQAFLYICFFQMCWTCFENSRSTDKPWKM
jgi:hypothetical protein